MAAVQSLGALVATDAGSWTALATYGSLSMYNHYSYDYATLYKTQPNVRTCVDFLARNIAQLGLHVFQRVGETDRRRLRDHPLAMVLEKPLPAEYKVTRYRLIECLVADLGVYFNAVWLKVKAGDLMGLLRIPPPDVTINGGLVPTSYEVVVGGITREVGPAEVVHIRGYNAENPIWGLSPLETLRRVLAEEQASGEYRENFWNNAARMHGIIERPAEAPEWSETARERFRAEFESLYAGAENSGKTAVLEEGMTWKQMTFSAQESEYLLGRKLTREECARAYHIPLPMVGILDNATFSNIREQHKNLYQDCLGPWLSMIEQEIMLQLLPDCPPTEGVYCEFNIQEKLQGSFEEQTASLQAAVGRPWMTADEARARMNLPSMGGDAEELALPMNLMVGGGTGDAETGGPGDAETPTESTEEEPEETPEKETQVGKLALQGKGRKAKIDPTMPRLRKRHQDKWAEVLKKFFSRQRDAVLGKMPAAETEKSGPGAPRSKAGWWDKKRWDKELKEDLKVLNKATATVWARHVADEAGEELNEDWMEEWLDEHSRVQAEEINSTSRAKLAEAMEDEEDPRGAVEHLFDIFTTTRAAAIAVAAVTAASSFGSREGARQSGLRTKTWQVNSGNPRPDHAAMDGETVDIEDVFSNGMRWPGDPAGGADNNAGCECSLVFSR